MTRWQRRARIAAGLVAVTVASGAYWMMGTRRTQPPPPPVTPLAPKVTSQVSGGRADQTTGVREDVSVDFKEQRTYDDGRTVATDVTVRVENRGGRSFVVTGKEGEVGNARATLNLTGDVVVKASDGLTAWAGSASYSDGEGIVRAPGPVKFARGDTAGSGIGFSFDKMRDLMVVQEQAAAHIDGGNGAVPMDVSAGTLTEARRDRYIRLEGKGHIVRNGQVIEADEIMIYLLADRDEPDRMELRGNASIGGGQDMGSLQAMKARDINLDYADDGRTVEHVALASAASIALAGTAGAIGQRLNAEWIDIALGPGGALTSLVARDNLVATLPAATGVPARTVRAVQLTGNGGAGSALTSMHFEDQVEFREGGDGRTPPARTARSTTLTLALAPAGGGLERATFTGDARFEDGTMHAAANEARYDVTKGTLALVGKEGTAAPRVTDTGVQVDGANITIALDTNAIAATGSVSSVMQPASARPGNGDAHTPALLDGGQALYASAAELTYDSQARKGTYVGRARLWQGETTIRAERIVLDEGRGDLAAEGGVQSTLALDPAPGPAASGATPAAATERPRGTIARAESMTYEDAARTATYTKGARLSGPQGDVASDRIAIILAEASRTLERLEAYGAVTARVDGRDAKGARLTHYAADGRYLLTGTPVQFTEECRVTTGRTLTFYGAAGRIIVDGNEATRTVTKGGGRCEPTPPRH